MTTETVDKIDLENKVKEMYRLVANEPMGKYHFEMGRALAERLGYSPAILDTIPADSIESFAGVGYYFRLANISPTSKILDLGSGSGMDVFYAASQLNEFGSVTGVDMSIDQLAKASKIAGENGYKNVRFVEGYLDNLPFADETFDTIISNGVINLCADKQKVFSEAARVLRPGGQLILADIVSRDILPDSIVCNSSLWAACIGGAKQEDIYQDMIRLAGFTIARYEDNDEYAFISNDALGATTRYGVKSSSLLATKTGFNNYPSSVWNRN